jgi:predicted DsbA family dithiol-disulfide isomerase
MCAGCIGEHQAAGAVGHHPAHRLPAALLPARVRGLSVRGRAREGSEYTPRVLRAFFQENQDIGRLDVLGGIAAELDLNEAEFTDALTEGTYTEAHREALRTAEAYRVSVAPTVIIGDRHRIEGVPGAAQIRKAVLDAQAEAAEAEGAACGIEGC